MKKVIKCGLFKIIINTIVNNLIVHKLTSESRKCMDAYHLFLPHLVQVDTSKL